MVCYISLLKIVPIRFIIINYTFQNFPFLDLEKDKFIDFNPKNWRGQFLGPIYKRFICIREPSLFFIGLIDCSPVSNLCQEMQVLTIKYLIEGKIKLPSTNEMVQSFLSDLDLLRFPTPKLLYNFKLLERPLIFLIGKI